MPNEQNIQSLTNQPSGDIRGNETNVLLPPEVDTTRRTNPAVITSDAARVHVKKQQAELSRLSNQQIS